MGPFSYRTWWRPPNFTGSGVNGGSLKDGDSLDSLGSRGVECCLFPEGVFDGLCKLASVCVCGGKLQSSQSWHHWEGTWLGSG